MSRRHGTWPGCGALVLLAALGVHSERASAEQAPAETTAQQAPAEVTGPAVVFVSAARSRPGAAGFDGMEAQLHELAVRVIAAEPMSNLSLASQAFRAAELSRQHRALGAIWFGQDDSAQLRVYVYDAKHRQLTRRTLSRPDAAVGEEVAVVLRSAISALLAGEATALEPVAIPPARPAPPPPMTPPRERPARLLAGVAYTGTTYTSGTFQHGLQLLIVAQPTSRLLLGLDGVWLQPATLSGGGADAILKRYPAELFAGYAFAGNSRFRAYFETGLQLELVQRTTRISDPRLSPLPSEDRLRFAIVPRLRTLFQPGKGWFGFAAFGADITTDRYDYVVQSASGPVRLATRSVRPRLEAGVAVGLW